MTLDIQTGKLLADLRAGADTAAATPLKADVGLALRGVTLVGAGFIVKPEQSENLDGGALIKPYRNGKDLTDKPRGVVVIDAFGLTESELQSQYPASWQWLYDYVKPERDQNARSTYRKNWWIFAEPRSEWRAAARGLTRYIATPMTAKHRIFLFLESNVLPDQGLVPVASDDAFDLGVLSSQPHFIWSLVQGGTLEDRPRYNQSRCFETFPFPDATPEQQTTIRTLAEQLDAHRKRQQAIHPELTLTGMYNVLDKLRAGATLTAKDKTIHTQGLVSVLREMHDTLDRAVFAAYGWDDLAERLVGLPGATTPLPDKPAAQTEAEEDLLRRLVALNAERAAEESRGRIRWLRPDYQNPGVAAPEQIAADVSTSDATAATSAVKVRKLTWPKGMREQIAAVRDTLANQALTLEEMSARFKDPAKTTPLIVEALAALEDLGRVERANDRYRVVG